MATNMSKSIYDKMLHQLQPLISLIRDSRPYHWIMDHKEHIAAALYFSWMTGCCFWVYKIVTISIAAQTTIAPITTNPREANVYLFFGTFGLVFALLFIFYLFKFMYNIFHGGIQSLFSHRLHLFATPITYLILLYFAFSNAGTIKTSGMTMYNHVVQLVHTSKQKEIISQDRSKGLLDLLDRQSRR